MSFFELSKAKLSYGGHKFEPSCQKNCSSISFIDNSIANISLYLHQVDLNWILDTISPLKSFFSFKTREFCLFVCLFVTEEILYSITAGSDQGSSVSAFLISARLTDSIIPFPGVLLLFLTSKWGKILATGFEFVSAIKSFWFSTFIFVLHYSFFTDVWIPVGKAVGLINCTIVRNWF